MSKNPERTTLRIPSAISRKMDRICDDTGIIKWRLTADLIETGLRSKYPAYQRDADDVQVSVPAVLRR
jgi:hypothetical protein